MTHFPTHAAFYRPLAAATLALFLQACTRWVPAPLEPAGLPTAGQVRATLHTGQRVVVQSPVITNDTLRASVAGDVRWSRALRAKPGIPLAQINTLEVQKVDAGATAGLIVLTGVGVAAITLYMLAKSLEDFDVGCLGVACAP